MHEMALCEGILQTLQDSAKAQGFSKVKTVWLEIGSLAAVETEALFFSFDVVCRNTIAEKAALEIITIPGSAWCMQCAKPIAVQQRYDCCPECSSYQLQITGGEEMKIKELEVE